MPRRSGWARGCACIAAKKFALNLSTLAALVLCVVCVSAKGVEKKVTVAGMDEAAITAKLKSLVRG